MTMKAGDRVKVTIHYEGIIEDISPAKDGLWLEGGSGFIPMKDKGFGKFTRYAEITKLLPEEPPEGSVITFMEKPWFREGGTWKAVGEHPRSWADLHVWYSDKTVTVLRRGFTRAS